MALMKTVILKKTISVAAREGIRSFPVKTVANEAGCSEGLIFHYFGNRKGLVDMCHRYISDNFSNRMIEAGNEIGPRWRAFCDYMMENPEEASFFLSYMQINDGIEGLEAFREPAAVYCEGKSESFIASVVRLSVIIGCIYGSGVVHWSPGSGAEYVQILERMINTL